MALVFIFDSSAARRHRQKSNLGAVLKVSLESVCAA
jgi:hypothetical protein